MHFQSFTILPKEEEILHPKTKNGHKLRSQINLHQNVKVHRQTNRRRLKPRQLTNTRPPGAIKFINR